MTQITTLPKANIKKLIFPVISPKCLHCKIHQSINQFTTPSVEHLSMAQFMLLPSMTQSILLLCMTQSILPLCTTQSTAHSPQPLPTPYKPANHCASPTPAPISTVPNAP